MTVKVLHLRSSAGFYGAERVIVTLMSRSPEDVSCHLACIENYINGDQSLLIRARDAGLEAVEIPCKSRMDVNTIRHLIDYCRSHEIDVIHSHDYKSHFYGALVARFAKCKLVATLHGKTLGNIKNRVYEVVENLLLRAASHITVVSEPLYLSLSKTGLCEKLSLIANGVDDNHFSSDLQGLGKASWGFDSSDYVFGTIARMSEEKGHEILIRAFSILASQNKKVRLLLVGDGPLKETLIELAKSLGSEKQINFAGSRTEVEQILNDLDCYVSPSHTEGMPMSILEAMASALPIIATDVGAVGYLLREKHGELISAGDVEGLAEKLNYVVENAATMQDSGRKCRARVELEFSAGLQSQKFADIYRSIL